MGEVLISHVLFYTDLAGNLTIIGAVNHLSLMLPSYPPLTQPWDIRESHFCDADNIPEHCANTTICPCAHRLKIALGDVVDMVVVDENQGKVAYEVSKRPILYIKT